MKCQMFALCENRAVTGYTSEVIGTVMCCKRCKDKMEDLDRRNREDKMRIAGTLD